MTASVPAAATTLSSSTKQYKAGSCLRYGSSTMGPKGYDQVHLDKPAATFLQARLCHSVRFYMRLQGIVAVSNQSGSS